MSLPDVLVIGAGMVGVACARELAQEGLRVHLLDAGPPGLGATAEGMGHLVALDDDPAQLALTTHSLKLWHRLADRLSPQAEHHTCGTLWIAEDDDELDLLAERAQRLATAGVATETLDSADLRHLESNLAEGLAGALRVPDDAVVYPPAAVADLLAAEPTLQVETARVVALEGGTGEDDATACLAGGERRRAGWIVNAAGLHALDLLPEPLPSLRLAPRKGHLLITPRQPGFCRHQLVEVGYSKSTLSKEGASVAFNLQARPNGQLLLGSSRQYGTTDRAVEPEVLGRMVHRALRFVPKLRSLDILRTWTGFRAATQDHLPILGPVPGRPRLLLNAGHEGLGITNATGAAQLLADHLLNRPSSIPREPYAAERTLPEAA